MFRGDYKCHFSHWICFTLSPVHCTHSHSCPLWLHNHRTISVSTIFLQEMQNISLVFNVLVKIWNLLIKKLFLLSHIFTLRWNTTFTSFIYRSWVELWFIALVSPTFIAVFLLWTNFFVCFDFVFKLVGFLLQCMNLNKLQDSVILFVADACCQ